MDEKLAGIVDAVFIGDTFFGPLHLDTTKKKLRSGITGIGTHYETRVVRGDEMFRLLRADRPKVTKSCGRNCSGTVSTRCLFSTGSKREG